jgi:catalase
MSDEKNRTRHPPLSPSAIAGRLAVIGGLLFISALAFAYAGGWLTPDRLTPTRMVAALSDRSVIVATIPRAYASPACSRPTGRLHSIQSHPCWSRAVIPLSAGSP